MTTPDKINSQVSAISTQTNADIKNHKPYEDKPLMDDLNKINSILVSIKSIIGSSTPEQKQELQTDQKTLMGLQAGIFKALNG